MNELSFSAFNHTFSASGRSNANKNCSSNYTAVLQQRAAVLTNPCVCVIFIDQKPVRHVLRFCGQHFGLFRLDIDSTGAYQLKISYIRPAVIEIPSFVYKWLKKGRKALLKLQNDIYYLSPHDMTALDDAMYDFPVELIDECKKCRCTAFLRRADYASLAAVLPLLSSAVASFSPGGCAYSMFYYGTTSQRACKVGDHKPTAVSWQADIQASNKQPDLVQAPRQHAHAANNAREQLTGDAAGRAFQSSGTAKRSCRHSQEAGSINSNFEIPVSRQLKFYAYQASGCLSAVMALLKPQSARHGYIANAAGLCTLILESGCLASKQGMAAFKSIAAACIEADSFGVQSTQCASFFNEYATCWESELTVPMK